MFGMHAEFSTCRPVCFRRLHLRQYLALQNHRKQINFKFSRRQGDANSRAEGAQHVDALAERLELGGQDESAVSALAIAGLLDGLHDLGRGLALDINAGFGLRLFSEVICAQGLACEER